MTGTPLEVLMPQYAPAVTSALQLIAMVPSDTWPMAIEKIERQETIGPMLDPTSWQGGAFRTSQNWRDLFEHLQAISAFLQPEEASVGSRQ